LILAVATARLAAPTRTVAQPEQGVRPPQLLQRTEATYPPAALAERREGSVTAEVTVDATGHVTDPKIVESGGKEFDDAALAALSHWVFAPAEESGKPISVRIRIPFAFRLPPPPPPEQPAPQGPPATAQPPSPAEPPASRPAEAPAKPGEELEAR